MSIKIRRKVKHLNESFSGNKSMFLNESFGVRKYALDYIVKDIQTVYKNKPSYEMFDTKEPLLGTVKSYKMPSYFIGDAIINILAVESDVDFTGAMLEDYLDYSTKSGIIIINTAIINDTLLLKKTLSHEIRHFEDYINGWYKDVIVSDKDYTISNDVYNFQPKEYTYDNNPLKLLTYYCNQTELNAYLQYINIVMEEILVNKNVDEFKKLLVEYKKKNSDVKINSVDDLTKVNGSTALPIFVDILVSEDKYMKNYYKVAKILQSYELFKNYVSKRLNKFDIRSLVWVFIYLNEENFGYPTAVKLNNALTMFMARHKDYDKKSAFISFFTDERYLGRLYKMIMQRYGQFLSDISDSFKEMVASVDDSFISKNNISDDE